MKTPYDIKIPESIEIKWTPDTYITGTTNKEPKSCEDLKCSCHTMWSLATQFAYLRLCSKDPSKNQYRLIRNYAIRARRIAGTYARLYLEQEDFSDPTKKGRFYWMALGALAAKTVACALEDLRTGVIYEHFGKGNFWLFMDIATTHCYWAMEPESFQQCASARPEVGNYVETVQTNLKRLSWHDEAMEKLKNLPVTEEILEAFNKIKEFESADKDDKPAIQLDHLIAVAKHEQGKILQPLMHDDPDFSKWVKLQRSPWIRWATPALEFVFTHQCATSDPKLKSVAPEGTVLEDFDSRMEWINKAAEDFHELMQTRTAFMEQELAIIAGWFNTPAKIPVVTMGLPHVNKPET